MPSRSMTTAVQSVLGGTGTLREPKRWVLCQSEVVVPTKVNALENKILINVGHDLVFLAGVDFYDFLDQFLGFVDIVLDKVTRGIIDEESHYKRNHP